MLSTASATDGSARPASGLSRHTGITNVIVNDVVMYGNKETTSCSRSGEVAKHTSGNQIIDRITIINFKEKYLYADASGPTS
jgi:hypothetical protein